MNKTLLPIRLVFMVLCAAGGWLVCYTIQEWDDYRLRATIIGLLIGVLVVLVDIMLKGFSLRGLSAITFGLAVGALVAFFISSSPLFEYGDPQTVYLFRLALFLVFGGKNIYIDPFGEVADYSTLPKADLVLALGTRLGPFGTLPQYDFDYWPKKANIVTLSEGKIAVMIFVAPDIRIKTMIAVLAYTGIRNDELTSLRVRDIDTAQQSLTVECGKGAKGRVCCISGDCLEILAEYLSEPRWYAVGSGREKRLAEPDDLLFVTLREGKQMEEQSVRKWVRKVARAAKIDTRVWPHLFRHSFATQLINRGAAAHSVQALLGHSDLSTTMTYYLHPSVRNTRADYTRCVPNFL